MSIRPIDHSLDALVSTTEPSLDLVVPASLVPGRAVDLTHVASPILPSMDGASETRLSLPTSLLPHYALDFYDESPLPWQVLRDSGLEQDVAGPGAEFANPQSAASFQAPMAESAAGLIEPQQTLSLQSHLAGPGSSAPIEAAVAELNEGAIERESVLRVVGSSQVIKSIPILEKIGNHVLLAAVNKYSPERIQKHFGISFLDVCRIVSRYGCGWVNNQFVFLHHPNTPQGYAGNPVTFEALNPLAHFSSREMREYEARNQALKRPLTIPPSRRKMKVQEYRELFPRYKAILVNAVRGGRDAVQSIYKLRKGEVDEVFHENGFEWNQNGLLIFLTPSLEKEEVTLERLNELGALTVADYRPRKRTATAAALPPAPPRSPSPVIRLDSAASAALPATSSVSSAVDDRPRKRTATAAALPPAPPRIPSPVSGLGPAASAAPPANSFNSSLFANQETQPAPANVQWQNHLVITQSWAPVVVVPPPPPVNLIWTGGPVQLVQHPYPLSAPGVPGAYPFGGYMPYGHGPARASTAPTYSTQYAPSHFSADPGAQ